MKKARRVTGNDVTQAGGLIALIDKLVDQAKTAKMDEKERASGMLHSLTGQPSGLDPKQTEPNAIIIARRRGILPLVTLVSEGSTVAQLHACGALANIAKGKQEYQQQIFEAGGVPALISVLRGGDPGVQDTPPPRSPASPRCGSRTRRSWRPRAPSCARDAAQ